MTRIKSPAHHAAVLAAVIRPALAGSRLAGSRLAGGALAGLLMLALTSCSGGSAGPGTPQGGTNFVGSSYNTTFYQVGSRSPAPAVSGTTLTGQRLSLGAMRGSVVVLNFWGSWCPPCRREAPALAALSEHFGSDRVRFVGVDIRDSVPNAEAFDRTFGVSYPSLNDPGGVIALAFHGTVPPKSFPTTLVVDSSGHIAASVFGAASYDGLRGLIAKVLAGKS